MTISQRRFPPAKAASTNDPTDLCVLGLLFRDARPIEDLITAVRTIDAEPWSPTREVVECSLLRLIDQNSVVCLTSGPHSYYSVTSTGIRRFFDLLTRPLAGSAFQTHCMLALKSAFLEDVPRAIRTAVVQDLKGYYACKLTCLEKDCDTCLMASSRTKVHHNLQVMHIQTELDWLSQVAQSA